jgi:hypothetical protein
MDNIIEGGSFKLMNLNKEGSAYLVTMIIEKGDTGNNATGHRITMEWDRGDLGTTHSHFDIVLDTKYAIKIEWENPGTFTWYVDDVSKGTSAIDKGDGGEPEAPMEADQFIIGIGVDEFSGPFSATTVQVDNINVEIGGAEPEPATHGKDGTVSFTMPSDIAPTYMFAKTGYWYQLSLASGDLDSEVELASMTYEGDMLRIHNVFDDVPASAIEAYFDDNSASTVSFYSAAAVTLDEMTSSDKLSFNFL